MSVSQTSSNPPGLGSRLGFWLLFTVVGGILGGFFGHELVTAGPVSFDNDLLHGVTSAVYLQVLKLELAQNPDFLIANFYQQYGMFYCVLYSVFLGTALSVINMVPHVVRSQRQGLAPFNGFVQARVAMGMDLIKGIVVGFVFCAASVVAVYVTGHADLVTERFLVGTGLLTVLLLFFFEKLALLELLTLPTRGLVSVALVIIGVLSMLNTRVGAHLIDNISGTWTGIGIAAGVLFVVNALFFHFFARYLTKRFGA